MSKHYIWVQASSCQSSKCSLLLEIWHEYLKGLILHNPMLSLFWEHGPHFVSVLLPVHVTPCDFQAFWCPVAILCSCVNAHTK